MKKRGSYRINKKGQVAMEFLMTYGWAIIIIVIAVAALFVLLGGFGGGVTNTCNAEAPFNCGEIRVEDGGANDKVTLTLGAKQISGSTSKNKLETIVINGVDCTIGSRSSLPSPTAADDARQSLQTFECTTVSDIGGTGDTFSGTVELVYEKQSAGGLARKSRIEISGEIEKQTAPLCDTDGICEAGETLLNCQADCAVCPDGVCHSPTEDINNCAADCTSGPVCPDGTCDAGEDLNNCQQDCAICGDGTCSAPTENSGNCIADCPLPTTTTSTLAPGATTTTSSTSSTSTSTTLSGPLPTSYYSFDTGDAKDSVGGFDGTLNFNIDCSQPGHDGSGQSCYFDGAGDYIGISTGPGGSLDTVDEFTVEYWINLDSSTLSSNRYPLFKWQDYYHRTSGTSSTSKSFAAYAYFSGTSQLIGTTTITTSQWHHIAMTSKYDGSSTSTKVYIDSSTAPVMTHSKIGRLGGSGPDHLAIGPVWTTSPPASGTATMLGSMDEIKYYDQELTQIELDQIFA